MSAKRLFEIQRQRVLYFALFALSLFFFQAASLDAQILSGISQACKFGFRSVASRNSLNSKADQLKAWTELYARAEQEGSARLQATSFLQMLELDPKLREGLDLSRRERVGSQQLSNLLVQRLTRSHVRQLIRDEKAAIVGGKTEARRRDRQARQLRKLRKADAKAKKKESKIAKRRRLRLRAEQRAFEKRFTSTPSLRLEELKNYEQLVTRSLERQARRRTLQKTWALGPFAIPVLLKLYQSLFVKHELTPAQSFIQQLRVKHKSGKLAAALSTKPEALATMIEFLDELEKLDNFKFYTAKRRSQLARSILVRALVYSSVLHPSALLPYIKAGLYNDAIPAAQVIENAGDIDYRLDPFSKSTAFIVDASLHGQDYRKISPILDWAFNTSTNYVGSEFVVESEADSTRVFVVSNAQEFYDALWATRNVEVQYILGLGSPSEMIIAGQSLNRLLEDPQVTRRKANTSTIFLSDYYAGSDASGFIASSQALYDSRTPGVTASTNSRLEFVQPSIPGFVGSDFKGMAKETTIQFGLNSLGVNAAKNLYWTIFGDPHPSKPDQAELLILETAEPNQSPAPHALPAEEGQFIDPILEAYGYWKLERIIRDRSMRPEIREREINRWVDWLRSELPKLEDSE